MHQLGLSCVWPVCGIQNRRDARSFGSFPASISNCPGGPSIDNLELSFAGSG